jgi:hypothetical protein
MYFAVHLINFISETVILGYYWFQRRPFTPTCADVPVSILEFILIVILNFINVSSIFTRQNNPTFCNASSTSIPHSLTAALLCNSVSSDIPFSLKRVIL